MDFQWRAPGIKMETSLYRLTPIQSITLSFAKGKVKSIQNLQVGTEFFLSFL